MKTLVQVRAESGLLPDGSRTLPKLGALSTGPVSGW